MSVLRKQSPDIIARLRRRISGPWLIASVLFLPALLGETMAAVTLELNPRTCLPGDLIRLRAERVAPDFATFELSIPSQKSLQMVGHERSPVSFANGMYRQTELRVWQALAPDTIRMDGITAQVKRGDQLSEVPLPPLELEVRAYPTEEAPSLEPEPLPIAADLVAKNNRLLNGLFFLFAAAGLALLLWRFRRQKEAQL